MDGEELFKSVELMRDLDVKRNSGNSLSESEVLDYMKAKNKTKILSIEDIKNYHDYVRVILKNVNELKLDLLTRFGEVCSPNSLDLIKGVIEETFDTNLYLKDMWN